MTKAEDRYLDYVQDGRLRNCSSKEAFLYGYRSAEKDNELTIDDIMKLDALLIKSWNETKGNPDYEGVLNQFNNERYK